MADTTVTPALSPAQQLDPEIALMSVRQLSAAYFRQACESWLESRKYHISPRTYLDYRHYIKKLSPYFGQFTLSEIDGDMLRSYQYTRRQKAGPGAINKELGIIIQVRKRIGQPIDDYQPLQMPKDYEGPGRALTPSEEAAFEQVCKAAATHPKWDVAALVSLLSMKTGMGPGEILSLKIKDVTIGEPSYISVPRRGAKRVRRERTVVLLGDALWAIQLLLTRASDKCGATLPEHFLIPRMKRDHSYDPTLPCQHYRGTMEHLLAICDTQFRRYDLRHHAVSKALNDPKVSLSAATLHFGHISEKMKKRYYHGDLETLRIVAAALGKKSLQDPEVQARYSNYKAAQRKPIKKADVLQMPARAL